MVGLLPGDPLMSNWLVACLHEHLLTLPPLLPGALLFCIACLLGDPANFFFFSSCFLGPQLQHVEIPKLGVELQLQLLAYITATATWDLSRVCDLHHCS